MSVIVPTYVYTYIRIEFLKKLLMDDDILKQMKKISNIMDLIDFISPYYPDLEITDFSIEEIEKALYHIFFKIIGRIITYSPQNMRSFLKTYLLQYEIMNIKQIILGSIIGLSRDEKSKNVDLLVEEYLENVDFIKGLYELTSLDEIRLYMKGTKYFEAIKEGVLFFKNTGEIFVLECFLDQLFYKNLKDIEKEFTTTEKLIISQFIASITEIYNINIIYRGILNKIDKNLLSQFLVDNYLFFNGETIQTLLIQEKTDEFFTLLANHYKKIKEIRNYYRKSNINREHLHWWLEGLYVNYFFNKFKKKLDNIEYSTILRIIEVIIKKQKEIKFDILPHVVSILHDKYEMLKEEEKEETSSE